MAKTTHTHRGTCQACGATHAVDNVTCIVAKHGYTVDFGYFQGVCRGGRGYKPAEFDVSLTHGTIISCTAAAESHEQTVTALKSGETVPATFERWNPTKVVVKRDRWGLERKTPGGYDVLPIAQATHDERVNAINSEIFKHQHHAAGLRRHVEFLVREVLPRFGRPLYDGAIEAKRVYAKAMRFVSNGMEIELTRPAYNHSGHLMGWYAKDVAGNASGKEFRYNTRTLNQARLPGEAPKKVEGSLYPTKVARKEALDKLSRRYDRLRDTLQKAYLTLCEAERTEAKTEIYYGPYQLSHWRPKHSEAVLREFPQLAAVVAEIDELVKAREAIKAAP